MMLKAIYHNGAIVPVDPVPIEWKEGDELEVARSTNGVMDIDAWVEMMNDLCADSLPEEEKRMQAAIDEQHKQAKAQIQQTSAQQKRTAL